MSGWPLMKVVGAHIRASGHISSQEAGSGDGLSPMVHFKGMVPVTWRPPTRPHTYYHHWHQAFKHRSLEDTTNNIQTVVKCQIIFQKNPFWFQDEIHIVTYCCLDHKKAGAWNLSMETASYVSKRHHCHWGYITWETEQTQRETCKEIEEKKAARDRIGFVLLVSCQIEKRLFPAMLTAS